MTPRHEPIIFVSLGMLVLDELRFPNQAPRSDLMGGSGCWSTLGARLLVGSANAQSIGFLVLAGHDFPSEPERVFSSWDVTLELRRNSTRGSTRGLLEYEDDTFGPKKFQYTSGPIKPSPNDLVGTWLLGAKAFHMLATPENVISQVAELLSLRRAYGFPERPRIIWEPFPASCNKANLLVFERAVKVVDVFSPNHIEMAGLFYDNGILFDRAKLEECAKHFVDSGIGETGAGCVVVRAGEHGCMTAVRGESYSWIPPFYGMGAKQVVDPTGAGNAFLGGFAVGLERRESVKQAVVYGSVAASFAIEQVGVPSQAFVDGEERWNGVDAAERLDEFQMTIRQNNSLSGS